ncbi:MAG: hypothetical protein IKN32_01565, partial [Bacteroidales bacterium]|nr:hypothetical protein [Bacteroidales bacterium]
LLARFFLFALPCGQKSRESCRLFPFVDCPGTGTLISWIFIWYRWLRAMDCFSAGAVFPIRLALRAEILGIL